MVPRKMVTRNPSALISTSISILMFVTFTALYHDVHGYSTYYYYYYWKMNPIGGTINLSYNDPRAITIIPAAASTKKRASVRSTSSSMALLASTKEGMSEKLSDSSSGCSSSNTKTKKIRTLHPNLRAFLKRNFFLVGMAVGVTVAKLFPSWGTAGTIPELVLSKYGVFLVFLLSGLSLELQDLKASILDFRLNMLIQCFNLLVWPCLVGLPTVTVLQKFSHHLPSSIFALPKELLDGILIVSCLPTTINMCVFLSSASNANVATALCNAILGNLLGILVTPAWLLYFFGGTTQGGATIDLPFHSMVSKLCSKVLLPVSIGQMLRQITAIKHWYKSNSQYFKRASELCLIGIAWTAFCNAFTSKGGLVGGGTGVLLGPSRLLSLLTILLTLHLSIVWSLFHIFQFLGYTKEEVVAATFTASHKTMAFGLPLIKVIFDGNPNLASYCVPVMMIHPLQLSLGSLMVPWFKSYISRNDEQEEKQQITKVKS